MTFRCSLTLNTLTSIFVSSLLTGAMSENECTHPPKTLDTVELATSVAAVSFFFFLFIHSHLLCCSRGGGIGALSVLVAVDV